MCLFSTNWSSRSRGDHRLSPTVHGRDDLVGVDALQIDAGHAEVAVPERALDHVHAHAPVRERRRPNEYLPRTGNGGG
jgi:hypothetical protein